MPASSFFRGGAGRFPSGAASGRATSGGPVTVDSRPGDQAGACCVYSCSSYIDLNGNGTLRSVPIKQRTRPTADPRSAFGLTGTDISVAGNSA